MSLYSICEIMSALSVCTSSTNGSLITGCLMKVHPGSELPFSFETRSAACERSGTGEISTRTLLDASHVLQNVQVLSKRVEYSLWGIGWVAWTLVDQEVTILIVLLVELLYMMLTMSDIGMGRASWAERSS